MKLNFIKFDAKAKQPTYATDGSAGLDFYAVLDRPINISGRACEYSKVNEKTHSHMLGGQYVVIDTGIGMEIPPGYVGIIKGRSGWAFDNGLFSFGGSIDSSYRGEIRTLLYNIGCRPVLVNPGDRVFQMIIMPHETVDMNEVQELTQTERGAGGFGSTGKQ